MGAALAVCPCWASALSRSVGYDQTSTNVLIVKEDAMTRPRGRFWVKQAKRTYDGPPRAAILCRQSIRKNDSVSLEDQEIRNRAYCEQQGYTVVDVRHSPNVRGWKDDRADHAHFRELAAAGEVDIVVSYDVFRTARTMRIMEMFAHDLETTACKLEFSSQPEANTPLGRQMITMLAEMETSARSVKLADTWDTLRRKGHWHGQAPYGYRRANKTIIPADGEAETAQRIFALALDGRGTVAIRDLLIDDGTSTRSGAPWDESMLSRMLRNPAYAGGMVIDDAPAFPPDGTVWHEPLIARGDWEQLQRILPTHAILRRKAVSSWLEGLVIHACNRRMHLVGSNTPRGTLLPVFRCAHRYKNPRCRELHAEVSAVNLETAARLAIHNAISGRQSVDTILRGVATTQKADGSAAARRDIHKRRMKLETARIKAENMHLTSDRSYAWWKAKETEITTALAGLDAEEARIEGGIDPAAVRQLSDDLETVASLLPDAPDRIVALALRQLHAVLVVGDGGVTVRVPEAMEHHVPRQPPVKIPRARTR